MDVQAIDPTMSATAAEPAQAPAAAPAPNPPPHQLDVHDETLHHALSRLVGGGSNVSVQFRVMHHPNEIVTVFKNADTGEEIAQFPTETMIQIAQFFDKLAGAVVDRAA